MPRADFYLISKPRFADDPLKLVCELAKRCHGTGKSTLILCRDTEQAEALDEQLWAFEDEAYIPHQIAGLDEDDDITPVLLATPDADAADRPLVINLRDEAFAGRCERVLEVVPADPAAREPLRRRWRDYQGRGYEMFKHDM